MPHLNEYQKATLLTLTAETGGFLPELESRWLKAMTSMNAHVNEMWPVFLTSKGFTTGTLNERQLAYWYSIGASVGSTWNEAYRWFWESGGGGPAELPLPVFQAVGTTQFSNVTTTQSCTAPAGITAGDFLLLLVGSSDASGGQQERWVAPPAGWTRLGQNKLAFACTAVFYKIANGSEGAVTITNVTAVGQYGVAYYCRFTGVDPATPFNGVYVHNATIATNYSPAGSGGSINAANCLGVNIVACRVSGGSSLITVAGSGWTRQQAHPNGGTQSSVAFSTKPMTTIGQQTAATFSCANSTEWATMTLALNPVGAVAESGYPVLASYSTSKSAADTPVTSFVIAPPAGLVAGNMMLLMVNAMTTVGGYVCSTPAGWNLLGAAGTTLSDAWTTFFWKVAVGGETNLTVNHSSAHRVAWWARITGCSGVDGATGVNETVGAQIALFDPYLIPVTTHDKCLLLGHFCIRNGVHGIDRLFGGGNMATVVEDTCANTINNCYSQMISGKASRAGANAGSMIVHSRETGAGSGQEYRSAYLAAFYP